MDRLGGVIEGAHPDVSKPPGADSSKSGREGPFGSAARVGCGLEVGRGDGDGGTAVAVSGVGGAAAGALVAAGAGNADIAVGAATERSSTVARTRSAGATLSARLIGAAAGRVR